MTDAGELAYLTAAEHARRASSFGESAAEYARHRPDYPIAALEWALPVTPSTPRVLDLAAGTGKLTASLLRCSAEVLAVEPDVAMLAELRAALPAVPAVCGSAEHLPLASGSVDVVCVGQAFHWFDADRALPELARVLRRGGVLLALWNYTDKRVEWAARLERARYTGGSWSQHPRGRKIPEHPLFSPADERTFDHTQRRTAETMVATLATHSNLLALSKSERAEALRGLTEFLANCPETARGEFDLPLRTVAVRMVRAECTTRGG